MSYIGNQPTTTAFLTDTFSANGSGTVFTLSAAPANTNSIIVAVSGVLQDPSTYSVSGTTLTFSAAPPAGTGNISVRFLGIPASGVTTTAYRTVTEFTATAGQTTFTPPSYTVGYINVYRNGALLGTADYTATNGTTVVLASAASSGDLVVVESFYVSSVLNAVPTTGGTFSGNVLFASGNGIWNTSGNVGIGTSSPDIFSESYQINLGLRTTGATAAFQISGASASRILLGVGTTRTAQLYSDSANFTELATSTAKPLLFSTNSTERGRFDTSGNFLFNSGYGSVATAYGCRAWVNFNGTGTVAIRASGNVSSITDNGTGLYTANFTTAMPDANYAAMIGANINNSNTDMRRDSRVVTWSTSNVFVVTGDSSGNSDTKEDYEFVTIAVFR
jgi:hypothetical protein